MHILMYADRPAGLGGIETHLAALSKELARLGIEVTVAFNEIRRSGTFDGAKALGVRVAQLERHDLNAFVAGTKVDVFHAHSCGAAEWGIRNAGTLGLSLVVTLHGPDQRLPSSLGMIDKVIAVSDETARPLLHLGERVVVIENGIDLARFAPAKAHNSPRRVDAGPLSAAYLGRVGPAKRLGLEALHKAIGARSDIEIRYVSDWAPHGTPEPTDDPARVLQRMDIVFTTGRGVREAMACGAAACVLGVFWDGLVTPERFDRLRFHNFSGRASRLRPSQSAIAQTVYSLISDRRRLAELQRFGIECAARHWDVRKQAALTLRVYEEVIAARGIMKT